MQKVNQMFCLFGILLCQGFSFATHGPLSLNLLNANRSQDKIVKPYMIDLRTRIQANWHPAVHCNGLKAKVFFQILPNGDLAQLTLQDSSRDKSFDDVSILAVQLTAPFAQPPVGGIRLLNIVASFDGDLAERTTIRRPEASGFASHQPSSAYGQFQQAPIPSERPPVPLVESMTQVYDSRQAPFNVDGSSGTSPQRDSGEKREPTGNVQVPNSRFQVQSAERLRSYSRTELTNYWNALKDWLDKPYTERKLGL